jgi:putative NADH-flavin reductase
VTPRRIALFGGTGRVGRHVLAQALARGHAVTGLVRQAEYGGSSMTDGVTWIPGDVLSLDDATHVVAGADAVLSSLGAPGLERPGTILSDGMRTIVRAATLSGVRRIVAVAGSGILDAPSGGLVHDQPGFPEIYRAISAEHQGTWDALRESALDWTVVCTTTQVEGARPDMVRAEADRLPAGGTEIAIEDIASFMLAQLDDPRFHRRRVGLTW